MYDRGAQVLSSDGKLILCTFPLGDLLTNSYLIFNKETKKGFVIDLGADPDELFSFAKDQGIDISFVALTHAHFDHIAGLKSTSLPFYVHSKDKPFLKDQSLNGSYRFGMDIAVDAEPMLYKDAEGVSFEGYKLDILHVPGHTPGSVAIKIDKWLFSGDALFFNSIGRTDVPLGSQKDLLNSIKKNILTLDEEIIVWPGHGPSTTVGREKQDNPFLI